MYDISNYKGKYIRDLGGWNNNSLEWILTWRRNTFTWHSIPEQQLFIAIMGQIMKRVINTWISIHGDDENYSVKNTYSTMHHRL